MSAPKQIPLGGFVDSGSFLGSGSINDPFRVSGGGSGTVGPGTLNAIAKFTGATAVGDARASDTGVLFTISERALVNADFADAGVQHGALTVLSVGVGLTAFDGGVQSFQSSTYDTSGGPVQSLAGFFQSTASKAVPGNTLTNYGVIASAAGGDVNYAYKGLAGALSHDFDADVCGVGGGFTVGVGAAAAAGEALFHTNVTVDATKVVSLGSNVAGFQVPGSGVAFPRILLGPAAGAVGEQLVCSNTVPGISLAGISLGFDTTVEPTIRGGFLAWRGAGGGIGGGNEIGWAMCGGNNDFILGTVANDAALFTTVVGGRVCMSADGVGFTMGASLNAAGLITARSLSVGDPAIPANPRYVCTVGIGAPVAPGVNNGDEYTDATGVIGAIKFVWNAGGAAWVPYA